MAVIEYDSYKQKLLAMSDTFENLQKALDIESSKHEIARLGSGRTGGRGSGAAGRTAAREHDIQREAVMRWI